MTGKLIFALVLITYIIVFSNSLSSNPYIRGSSSRGLEYLRQSPDTPGPVTPLVSRRNFWGIPDDIEITEYHTFNPSVLSLPVLPYSNATLLVVARDEYDWIQLDKNTQIQPRNIVAA